MKKKLLVPVLCILMMLVGGFATWAYLTSDDSVTNTFTVGDVKITLDEADVDEAGALETNEDGSLKERVKENDYHLLPGHLYIKDPKIDVDSDSENCYVFVTVRNDIKDIEAPTGEKDYVSILGQMAANGWVKLEGVQKDGQDVYYYYNATAQTSKVSGGSELTVFENFRIAGNVTNTTLAGYETKTTDGVTSNLIVVKAFAIQADGFETPADAWKDAKGQF